MRARKLTKGRIKRVISGQVKTPGVHLEAVAILSRQFAAFTLDRWVAEEGAGVASYGRVGEALKAIKGGVRNRFPLFWFDFIAKNATRLFEGFVKLFPELSDQDSLANLHEFAHGGEKDGLAHLIAEEYREVETEIASIEKRVADNKKASDRLKQKKPPDLDQEDRLRQWVTKALLYGESLKPKTKAKPKAKNPTKKKK